MQAATAEQQSSAAEAIASELRAENTELSSQLRQAQATSTDATARVLQLEEEAATRQAVVNDFATQLEEAQAEAREQEQKSLAANAEMQATINDAAEVRCALMRLLRAISEQVGLDPVPSTLHRRCILRTRHIC